MAKRRANWSWSLLLAGSLAWAQSPDMERLLTLPLDDLLQVRVVSGNKYLVNIFDAPSVISTITAAEIAGFGANSLYEVLERATSVYMTGSHFFPQNVSSIRGDLLTHADNHVLLLLNGRPMRESYSGGINFPLYTAFPLAAIDRLEIIRGPGSVLYGSNAYAGVINIITRTVMDDGVTARVSGGSFDTQASAVTATWEQNELELLAAVRTLREDGWRFSAVDNNGNSRTIPYGEDNLGAFASARYRQWRADALFTSNTQDFMGAVTQWTGAPPVEERELQASRSHLNLGRRVDWSSSAYLDADFSAGQMRFSHYNYRSHADDYYLELTQHWVPRDDWHWLLGYGVWSQDFGTAAGRQPAPVPATSLWRREYYLQGDWAATPRLKLTAGLQHNRASLQHDKTVPRYGLIYRHDEHTGLKLMHAEAYRAAYGTETRFSTVIRNPDGTIAGGLRGNPALQPETVVTTDIQWFYVTSQHYLAVTAFRSVERNLITRVRAPDLVIDFVNAGELRLRGWTVEGKWQPGTFSLQGSWSTQRNETDKGAVDYTTVPRHLFKLGATMPLGPAARLGVFAEHVGDAGDIAVRAPSRQAFNPLADGYLFLTANLRLEPAQLFQAPALKPLAVEVYGYNLLDKAVYQPEFVGQRINTIPARAGRSVYASLVWRF